MIQNFVMSDLEEQHCALKTIANMLMAREWLSDDSETHYKTLIGKGTDPIDVTQINCINKKVAIKFYNLKLNTLKNDRDIDTFISSFADHHKIIVVNDISPKVEKQIMDSKSFEIFTLKSIIRDISKHHMVPKHILLSKEDGAKVMEEYKLQKKDMQRICIDDKMARYLYAQVDNVVQIIRPTINSGYATNYRLVIPSSINGA